MALVWGKCSRTSPHAPPRTEAEHGHDAVVEKGHGGKDAETYGQVWGWVYDRCACGCRGRSGWIVRVHWHGVGVHRHDYVLEGRSATW